MGKIFSCFLPKNVSFQRVKQKRRKQKPSKLQKIFENVDVSSSLQVEEVYCVLSRDGRVYDEAEVVKEEETGSADEVPVAEKVKKGHEKSVIVRETGDEDDEDTYSDDFESDHVTTDSDDGEGCKDGDLSGETLVKPLSAKKYDFIDSDEDQEANIEPTPKIFHQKTEDWRHFHTVLDKEYDDDIDICYSLKDEYALAELEIRMSPDDDAIYSAKDTNAKSEHTPKIFHQKKEDWRHFHAVLNKEYDDDIDICYSLKDEYALAELEYRIYPDDDAIYSAKDTNAKSEHTPKIFHQKTEDWRHFHAVLNKEYDDDIDICYSLKDEYALSELEYRIYPDDDVSYSASSCIESVMSNASEEDRWTPPLIEGVIYSGSGIMKKMINRNENNRRKITWASDVKPPAIDKKVIDPLVEAFMKERSRLVLQRTQEDRRNLRKARLASVSCRHVNNNNSRMVMEGCRTPVPVRGPTTHGVTQSRLPYIRTGITTASRIPVVVQRKMAIVLEPSTDLKGKRKRSHSSMTAKTAKGPNKRHTVTAEEERILHPAPKTPTNTARARVAFWR